MDWLSARFLLSAEHKMNVARQEPFRDGGLQFPSLVSHTFEQFAELSVADLRNLCREKSVIYDVKNLFPRDQVDGCL
jgi:hypothetical protein